MKNISKQFVGWDTLLSQDRFKRSVVILTIYYTIGVFLILVILNSMVYGLFTNSIKARDNERIEKYLEVDIHRDIDEDENSKISDDLVNILLISDIIILLLTIIVAYAFSKKTLEPLEISYRKQARFVADVAHELRTPLSVLKAGAEVVLNKERDPVEYKKFISESLDEVNRLTTLSNDLLFLVNNNKNLLMEKLSLSDLCKQQIEKIEPYTKAKNININKKIEDNINIKGNKDDIARLLMNLLKNAVDYNKINGEIFISLEKIGSSAIVTIRDTGIGIEKKDIPHIFERFYKADMSRTENSSSTGLGLSIVKEIIDEHKANIKIESELGKGTILKVIFDCV